jgi:ribosomal-protein-alanine N-acetyltransferase
MLNDKPLIEFAKPSDTTEIAALSKNEIEQGLGWKYTPEQIVRLINDDTVNVVVARFASRLAGFGIMTYYNNNANLDLLAVKRPYRRIRIGTHIVHWLEQVAITAGAYNIFVQVRSRNSPAVAFYENLGFLLLEEKKGYYRGVESALIMAKSIRRMFSID